jgi:hypothetical protein
MDTKNDTALFMLIGMKQTHGIFDALERKAFIGIKMLFGQTEHQ